RGRKDRPLMTSISIKEKAVSLKWDGTIRKKIFRFAQSCFQKFLSFPSQESEENRPGNEGDPFPCDKSRRPIFEKEMVTPRSQKGYRPLKAIGRHNLINALFRGWIGPG